MNEKHFSRLYLLSEQGALTEIQELETIYSEQEIFQKILSYVARDTTGNRCNIFNTTRKRFQIMTTYPFLRNLFYSYPDNPSDLPSIITPHVNEISTLAYHQHSHPDEPMREDACDGQDYNPEDCSPDIPHFPLQTLDVSNNSDGPNNRINISPFTFQNSQETNECTPNTPP
ncbi:hypothetical protein L873DRAFT_1795688 [Choiromyces venosus 120613-1]|uniref:Uncharacterized protein n=1 Tax=Choiromyces venosus 120613-1 TaxID=1336337 RepID=A0A3N4IV74_9PEZI|nr:hypothetical protein L873DRAFT_1795688 [Choiromyces venosus 120613-1]